MGARSSTLACKSTFDISFIRNGKLTKKKHLHSRTHGMQNSSVALELLSSGVQLYLHLYLSCSSTCNYSCTRPSTYRVYFLYSLNRCYLFVLRPGSAIRDSN